VGIPVKRTDTDKPDRDAAANTIGEYFVWKKPVYHFGSIRINRKPDWGGES
jgi:hypothetical protein